MFTSKAAQPDLLIGTEIWRDPPKGKERGSSPEFKYMADKFHLNLLKHGAEKPGFHASISQRTSNRDNYLLCDHKPLF